MPGIEFHEQPMSVGFTDENQTESRRIGRIGRIDAVEGEVIECAFNDVDPMPQYRNWNSELDAHHQRRKGRPSCAHFTCVWFCWTFQLVWKDIRWFGPSFFFFLNDLITSWANQWRWMNSFGKISSNWRHWRHVNWDWAVLTGLNVPLDWINHWIPDGFHCLCW